MLDRCDSCDHRTLHAFRAVRMCRNPKVIIRSRIDHSFEFFVCELRVLAVLRDAQHATGCRDLYPVGTVLVSLTNRLSRIVSAVDNPLPGPRVALDVVRPAIGRVCVATGGANSLGSREYSWSRNVSLLDCLAQCDCDIECVAKITNNGKSGLERALRVHGRDDRIIRFVHCKSIEPAVFGDLAGQVHMHVHQSRHHRV